MLRSDHRELRNSSVKLMWVSFYDHVNNTTSNTKQHLLNNQEDQCGVNRSSGVDPGYHIYYIKNYCTQDAVR